MSKNWWSNRCLSVCAAGLLIGTRAFAAEPGITAEEIRIGQCAALTGPAAGLGTGMRTGLKAAFDEVNEHGGVHGRKIRLISADDGYDPDRCVECTSKLIEEEHVFALGGYVGTPTAKVVVPMVQELKVPIIGLFTGAELLRVPVQRYVFNVRASYDDETEALVEHLTGKLGSKRIAVFYQNDSFGQAGLSGTEKALARRKLSLAGKGSFERNTLAVKSGFTSIIESKPDAVILVGPYKPTAEFIRQSKAAGLKAVMAAISFVGTENLIAELGAESDGVFVSQVVPSPLDPALPLSCEYRASLKKSTPDASPSYVSFEGYITGRVVIRALENAGADLSREKLIDLLENSSSLDLSGAKVAFSPALHQAFNSVYLTQLKNGQAAAIAKD